MRFAELTTIRVGGEIAETIEATTVDDATGAYRQLIRADEDFIVLGGGSNTVASDDRYSGTALLMRTRGIETSVDDGAVKLRVQAGEEWDALVAKAVESGWSGIEAMAGIPGSVGAAPIQNIGAYGQELASVLVAIDFLDAETLEVRRLERDELGLAYRYSKIKGRELRGLVLAVELRLQVTGESQPVAYTQLADALGAELGDRRPLAEVRDAVLQLRASKGMVLSEDPDSVSAGSFFTNPVVSVKFARDLPKDAPRFPAGTVTLDSGELVETVKLSAAWLIEKAGIGRGFSLGHSRAAISSKHTLAITNTGGATGEEIAELARFVQARVENALGVYLVNEPVLVGLQL
ncbi:MAG TPA: UDP-N-acetylmuramate dehydrogenase [Candidatus Agrococcus pullicola]|uniref:UDP-N-acetylenolpyruvoylglucosamine reductase n=1 Tax=Candidatus Agrococcus pullicola TaxID=2838429 RepID=A0A9D1YY91_9MICO|nr:UDP-N-acetylmuramate dehydrogenase [Candidatus Agrococcus pullicola]